MSSKVKRKLAAIMCTDIVDFTSISAINETKALELLSIQRETLLRRKYIKF